ncbi:hypothetical protein GCM10010415_04610 [Streptomyces atrovirens]
MARESESGLPIEPVYGPEALEGWDPAERLGEPGAYPFTRGVYPTMYTGRPWTMRQYAGFGTATESNARYQQLIANGATGLSVAFDLPTRMGHGSDAPIAHGEIGKVGAALAPLAAAIHNRSAASAGREMGLRANSGPRRRIIRRTVDEDTSNSGPSRRMVRFVR